MVGTGFVLGGGYMYRDAIQQQLVQNPKETLKKAACVVGVLGANVWLWNQTGHLVQQRIGKKIVKDRSGVFSTKSALLVLVTSCAVVSFIDLPRNIQGMLIGGTILNITRSLGYAQWNCWTDAKDSNEKTIVYRWFTSRTNGSIFSMSDSGDDQAVSVGSNILDID